LLQGTLILRLPSDPPNRGHGLLSLLSKCRVPTNPDFARG